MAQGAVRPGCQSAGTLTLETATRGKRRGTQCGNGLRRQRPARWEPRCKGKRLVCRLWPTGACENCGAADVAQQSDRRREGAAGRCLRSNRRVKRMRSWYALRRLHVKGEGIRDAVVFLSNTSWPTMMRRWVGMPRLGCGMPGETHRASRWTWVPAGAPLAVAGSASARVRTERDQTLHPRRPVQERSTPITGRLPSDRRDQPRAAELCPAEEGLKHSSRRTGRERGT